MVQQGPSKDDKVIMGFMQSMKKTIKARVCTKAFKGMTRTMRQEAFKSENHIGIKKESSPKIKRNRTKGPPRYVPEYWSKLLSLHKKQHQGNQKHKAHKQVENDSNVEPYSASEEEVDGNKVDNSPEGVEQSCLLHPPGRGALLARFTHPKLREKNMRTAKSMLYNRTQASMWAVLCQVRGFFPN